MLYGMTDSQSPAAEALSQTVWVLAQLRGYSTKQEMANAMGWDRTRLSRTLKGARQWTLEDLYTVADVLGLAGPGELFRPLGEIVGAIHPAAVNGSVGRAVSARYQRANGSVVIPFRQVRTTHRRYLACTTTLSRENRADHIASLIGLSPHGVTPVTTLVGL